jgi:hypothetical protein
MKVQGNSWSILRKYVIVVKYLFDGLCAYNSLATFASDSIFVENDNVSDVLTNEIGHTMIATF